MLLSNEMPRLSEASGALANRMIPLRLTQSFLGREDHELQAKIETELPSVLLWAIAGWRRLRERGRLLLPEGSQAMIEDFEDLSSPVGEFVRYRCEVGSDREIARRDLYAAYREWAQTHGRKRIEDETGFGKNLRAVVPQILDISRRISGARVRFYSGIDLML